jgi:hypothetical protein
MKKQLTAPCNVDELLRLFMMHEKDVNELNLQMMNSKFS